MFLKFALDETTALGGRGPHSLVDVSDAYDWENDKRGPRIGSYYTILRTNDMEKVRVLVRDTAPVIDQATVLQRVPTLQFVKVTFDRLTAYVTADAKRNLRITAEAAAVKVVNSQQQS